MRGVDSRPKKEKCNPHNSLSRGLPARADSQTVRTSHPVQARAGCRQVGIPFRPRLGWHGQVPLPVVTPVLLDAGKGACPCYPFTTARRTNTTRRHSLADVDNSCDAAPNPYTALLLFWAGPT